MFADSYARFIDLSLEEGEADDTAAERARQSSRLNERHEALITSNRDILDGARVLDLACHDARYAFAALRAGAKHATGVEARQSLLDRAEGAFTFYDQDPKTYDFVCGDVFDVLAEQRFDADVVFSFGFLYHTYRHTEFMYRLHQLRPSYLVMDTMVTHDEKPTLKLIRERDTADNRSAAQDPFSVGRVLVLRPSLPALELLLRSYGFEIESMHDWPGQLAGRGDIPGVRGYASGKRVSLRCRFRLAVIRSGRRAGAPLSVVPPAAAPGHRPAGTAAAAAATGWRGRVNRALSAATGYELRRATPRD